MPVGEELANWPLIRQEFISEVVFTSLDGTQKVELTDVDAQNLNSSNARVETLALACSR